MRKQVFKGQSIRETNGTQDGLPVFGKYAAVVSRQELSTCKGGENGDEWLWIGVNGCSGGNYATEEEAMDAAAAFAASRGYTEDPERAKRDAIAAVKERHNSHCARSESYLRHYGPKA